MRRFMILMVALSTVLSSCKKMEINRIERNLSEGEWFIYSFIENGKDQTDSGYSEYVFRFDKEGKVAARIQTLGVSVHGTWEVKKSDDKEVVLALTMNYPLQNLSETWNVTDENKRSIVLNCTSSKGYEKQMVFNPVE